MSRASSEPPGRPVACHAGCQCRAPGEAAEAAGSLASSGEGQELGRERLARELPEASQLENGIAGPSSCLFNTAAGSPFPSAKLQITTSLAP